MARLRSPPIQKTPPGLSPCSGGSYLDSVARNHLTRSVDEKLRALDVDESGRAKLWFKTETDLAAEAWWFDTRSSSCMSPSNGSQATRPPSPPPTQTTVSSTDAKDLLAYGSGNRAFDATRLSNAVSDNFMPKADSNPKPQRRIMPHRACKDVALKYISSTHILDTSTYNKPPSNLAYPLSQCRIPHYADLAKRIDTQRKRPKKRKFQDVLANEPRGKRRRLCADHQPP